MQIKQKSIKNHSINLGDLAEVESFIKNGNVENINLKHKSTGWTPLHYAAHAGTL